MPEPAVLERVLEVAREVVSAAADVGLRHHGGGLTVERKSDRSPVTVADREAERLARERIRAAFPDHGILGEEGAEETSSVGWRWIVDPIDGTRGYTRGGRHWGPLVGVEHEGELVVGAMALPVLERTYWAARGLGAWRDGMRLAVSEVDRWEDATLSVGEMLPVFGGGRADPLLGLIARVSSTRCYGDLAGVAMLLDGEADLWLEAGVQLWDLAPLQVLVEEAGGRFTDLGGERSLVRGEALAGNARLHAMALERLAASG